MNNNTNKNNVLPNLKTPIEFCALIAIIVLLVIILFCVMFKVPFTGSLNKSQEEIVRNVFIVLFFTFIICGLCISLLPSFKHVRELFLQISNVTYVIIYTIFLILLFTMMPSDIINFYSFIILPVTILLGVLFFYKGIQHNYVNEFNMNYERIKTMI
jgi:hypothetical protein